MAGFAEHIPMCTFQWKRGLFVVIKQRRLPFPDIVAAAALPAIHVGELVAMNIRVAL
ncbi:MAG TPA: hypothetical protein VEI49_01070 [Terriglobales bacterium]|nr:hypothetical protein [Terriglobales bacterium]